MYQVSGTFMSTDKKKEEEQHQRLVNMMFKDHFQITLRVAFLVIIPAIALGGIGYLIDESLGTRPVFLIGGLIAAFITTQVLTITVFTNITKKK